MQRPISSVQRLFVGRTDSRLRSVTIFSLGWRVFQRNATYLVELDANEREAIGQRARERVLAQHTAMHRAAELESYALELL